MKINFEIKPREWVFVAAFILLIYLIYSGNAEAAARLLKIWSVNK